MLAQIIARHNVKTAVSGVAVTNEAHHRPSPFGPFTALVVSLILALAP